MLYICPIDFCLPLAMAWLRLLYDLIYMIHHEMCGPPANPEKLLVLGFEVAQIDSGRQERQLPYEPPEELELRPGALSFDNHRTSLSSLQGRMVISYLRSPAGYPFNRARGAVMVPFFEWYIYDGLYVEMLSKLPIFLWVF